MATNTISVKLVVTDGTVDREASSEAFEAAVENYLLQSRTQRETIAGAVSEIFDAHKGAKITMPAIASMTCAKLNAQPENFGHLTELVLGYLRENTKGDDSLFQVSKGRGGGVARVSDLPVPAAK